MLFFLYRKKVRNFSKKFLPGFRDVAFVWLLDWLIDQLIDRLIYRSIDWSFHRLIVWLIDRSIGRLIDWLLDWLIDFSPWMEKKVRNFFRKNFAWALGIGSLKSLKLLDLSCNRFTNITKDFFNLLPASLEGINLTFCRSKENERPVFASDALDDLPPLKRLWLGGGFFKAGILIRLQVKKSQGSNSPLLV